MALFHKSNQDVRMTVHGDDCVCETKMDTITSIYGERTICPRRTSILSHLQEKDVDHEEIVKYECADHADPPTVQECEEADDICAKHLHFRMV